MFLIYQHSSASSLTALEIVKVFWYGAKLDVSFTGYLCILPFAVFIFSALFPRWKGTRLIRIYTILVILLLSFLTIADLGLFSAWGYRMDDTPLTYLTTPREMITSASSAPVFLLLVIFALLSVFFIWLYQKLVDPVMKAWPSRFSLTYFLMSLVLFAFLFIPIRGGIQKIPINLSDVYFSDKIFADQAAINLPWNIAFALLNQENKTNPFEYFPQAKAKALVSQLYDTGPRRIPHILNTRRPNIIFIIMESFTSKFVGCLGGEPGVTPNLDQIAANGLLFTHIYAAGDRSEKGQVAVLSGYPNQAITSIIKKPNKTLKLPCISRVLNQQHYQTSYTYGGELEFANIQSYLRNVGFDHLYGEYQFPEALRTTSWGVHDQYTLARLLKDVNQSPQPFFAALFTLSSHEPYDVPMKPRFKGPGETILFKNSVAYTDSCIGDFVRKLQKEPLWQNTLLVFVADHGHPRPGNDPNDAPSKFKIPLIFAGGALKMKGVINTIGSQTDIVTTVLDQLDLPTSEFKWGKDLLDSSAHQFAFYSFNNGFGFVDSTGVVTVDNVQKRVIRKVGHPDSTEINYGKAYMQWSYQDYLNR
ncbi:MAG: LTA synthase family protein [Bacteroidota bacterium]|nr:LTA synthase family protein [Bacteroidota bacterium]